MHRKLKTLGLALVAVLAMSAVVASAAQATNYTASGYPTSFTAETEKGNDTFLTEAGVVECKAHYSGTITKASETVSVTPKYTECKAFGFLNATVDMNGCTYTFHTNGEVDFVCPAGATALVEGGTCAATIGAQSGLKSVHQTNGSGDITVLANVKGIAYTATKDGIGCLFNGTGAKTGGTYSQHNAATVQSTSGTTIDIG